MFSSFDVIMRQIEKSEHVFIQKIIKSFNKKKTFCACIAHTKGYLQIQALNFTPKALALSLRTQTPRKMLNLERIFSTWHKIYFFFRS